MKTSLSTIVLFLMVLTSCNFRKSANVDLLTGLNTRGDGLSCEEVYLSNGETRLNRSKFTYGESFYLNFEDIAGFVKQGDYAFPGLRLSVLGPKGDTVLKKDDLYAGNTDGFNYSPLLLKAFLVVADPIHSGKEYTLNVDIWDKKGKGTFRANMNFEVVPDQKISLESQNVTWDEIYLFSGKSKATITDGQARFNDDIYLLFEGLKGFSPVNGMVNFGLSMKITDAAGEVLLDEADLVGDEGMEETKFSSQVAPNFVISNPEVANPVTCEVLIHDKNSDSRIKATVKLNMD
jgi:hypothetical protein